MPAELAGHYLDRVELADGVTHASVNDDLPIRSGHQHRACDELYFTIMNYRELADQGCIGDSRLANPLINTRPLDSGNPIGGIWFRALAEEYR